MSSHQNNHTEGEYIPESYIPHTESHGTKQLWKTFWILLFITVIDFIIYFVFPANMFRNITFIVLGVIKAILIIGIFMHLNFEAKFMRWMIILPAIIFISYLVAFLMIEGGFISSMKY